MDVEDFWKSLFGQGNAMYVCLRRWDEMYRNDLTRFIVEDPFDNDKKIFCYVYDIV